MRKEASRTGSIGRQILSRVAVTVAVMAIMLSLMTLAVAQRLLTDQLDQEAHSIATIVKTGGQRVERPGIRQDAILAVESDGQVFATVVAPGGFVKLTRNIPIFKTLLSGYQFVQLPEYGRYRFLVEDLSDGSRLFVGLPTGGTDFTLFRLALAAAVIATIAVAGTILMSRAIVKKATNPMDRLTRTASQVSMQPLDRGEVFVPRVDVSDLPADHEVARVGEAINLMLENIEGALAVREDSEQQLRRFVADASHELRNPLAAISGYSELMERHVDDLPPDDAFALSRISAESKRLKNLVNDLMILARLDAKQQQDPKPVDAVEAVLQAVADARASSNEHCWRLELPEHPVMVMAGSDQLQQVLVNLLGNARTHTPAGTTVKAGVRSDGAIFVSDNGPGIPPELLPHVFNRFTRADGSRTHTPTNSTGLGLAIVKAQVESFDGQVHVESRPGETTFTVRLPLAQKDQ